MQRPTRSTRTNSPAWPDSSGIGSPQPSSRMRCAGVISTATPTARATSSSAGWGRSCRGCATSCGRAATPGGPCNTRSGELALSAPSGCAMDRAMRLAASLPLPPDLAMCRRVAAGVEELGYASVWIAATGAGPDAFVVGAAVATCTSRLRIGTAVVPVYTRTPSVMAAGASSVAQLAPGRVVLGIGASSETIVDAWGGVPFERPLQRIRESVAVLRQMFAGERVTFPGRTIRTRGFRLVSMPPQPVPIYLAGLMPPMLELAG